MLISFSVANFRSFGEEQTLNMVASNKLTDHPGHLVSIGETGKGVLRCAVIYGANAAGKSNLVKAMQFARSVIMNGASTVDNFRFGNSWKDEPTCFEFRFLIDQRVFVYGFDLNVHGIQSEWLTTLEGERELPLFERDGEGKTTVGDNSTWRLFPKDDVIATTLKNLSLLPVSRSQLFLRRASELPLESQGMTLSSVIRWLTEDLIILGPEASMDVFWRLSDDPQFLRAAEELLRNSGTGINGLSFGEQEYELMNPLKVFLLDHGKYGRGRVEPDGRYAVRRLIASHGDRSDALSFNDESDGTKKLLDYLPVLSLGKHDRKVVVIDELDRSLHPLLCWEFIRLFSETAPGAHKQLIATTHEAHLLNQDLLRRDEYWFVEKDREQQSRLVSLLDFKVRNDLQIEKGYLQGRFGAIPVIGPTEEIERLLQPEVAAETADAS